MKTRSLRGTATTRCLPRTPSVWFCTLFFILSLLPQALHAQRDSLAGFDEAAAMEEIRQKGIPESDIPGYLEYKKQEFIGMKNGTWERHIPGSGNPPTVQAPCTNMEFETGDFTGWTGAYGTNPGCTPTCANFGFIANRHTIMTGAGTDPCGGFPVVAPGGNFSVKLGNNINGAQAEQLIQTFQVTVPTFIYTYAVVFQDPGHGAAQQPYFKVEMFDSLGLPINCANITYVAGPNIPGFFPSPCPLTVYRPWTSVAVDLSLYIGQNVTIRFTNGDCTAGGHYGYSYIDGSCLIGQITQSNALCTNGSTTLCAPPGFSSYQWSTNAQTPCITVTQPGNYSVLMTTQGGCPVIPLSINIQQFPSPTVNANATNTSCTGCTGTTSTNVVGGNAPYTYAWSPGGGTAANMNGMCAGTYTVVVTTADGCSDTTSTIVNNPANLLPAGSSSTPTSCNGGSNGTATVNASGGQPGYTYSWNTTPVQTGQTATGLAAGPYEVTVTDANGCMFTTTVIVTEPDPIVPLSVSQFNTSCFGVCDGSADIFMGGGNSPYAYLWSNGQTTQTSTGLCAGNHSVTVTDANGCTGTQLYTIMEPPPVTLTMSSTDASCGASNGSAIVVGGGGVGNFTYAWNTNPVQTNDTITGLPVGLYVATVTDGNLCSSSDTVQVFNPNAPTATVSMTPVTCFGGSDGTAIGTGAAGVPPLTYSWNSTPPQSNATATNLPAGSYTLTVTDDDGCQVVAAVTVTQPPLLTVAVAGFPTTCSNSCDGQAVVIPAGGTGTYDITWNTSQTTAGISGLCPAVYTVNVTDQNGCAASDTAQVNAPTPISISMNAASSLCGATTASATANPSGGVGGYTYLWSNSATTQTVNNLQSGSHIVTVTDANGCIGTDTINIINTPAVVATINATDVSCNSACDGSASITNISGTAPYTYAWSNSGTTQSISNLCGAVYSVTVTDSNNCTQTLSITIIDPPVLTATAAANPATICAGQNAMLTVTPAGGTGGTYTYAWSPVAGSTNTLAVTPAVTTSYTVLVTDSSGCPVTTTVNVNVNPIPVVNFTADLNGCQPFCTQMTNTSPTADSCIWDFGDGTFFMGCTPPVHCYQTPGTYPAVLTVMDVNGCANATPANANIVTVTPKPVAAFSVSPVSTSIFEPHVNFTDLSTGAVSWFWDFMDSLSSSPTSTLQNPSHTFSDTGMYCVRLAVTSADNCMDTSTICVVIEPEFTFFIPNAFTPDGDGVNVFFFGSGIGITKHQLWIFDRWGNMIFTSGESASPQTGVPWDGRANGGKEIAQQDVYVWKVALTDVFGRSYMYIGHVSLIK